MGIRGLIVVLMLSGCEGPAGSAGPAGAPGAAGAMGEMGTPGTNGTPGTSATPMLRWADANGTVVSNLIGTTFDFKLQYFDQQGVIWIVDRTTLVVSAADPNAKTSTTCGADSVVVGCSPSTDLTGVSTTGGFPTPPRISFVIHPTNEIRVRNDDAPAVMTDSCNDICPVLASDTRVVTLPVLALTGPLHPVLAP